MIHDGIDYIARQTVKVRLKEDLEQTNPGSSDATGSGTDFVGCLIKLEHVHDMHTQKLHPNITAYSDGYTDLPHIDKIPKMELVGYKSNSQLGGLTTGTPLGGGVIGQEYGICETGGKEGDIVEVVVKGLTWAWVNSAISNGKNIKIGGIYMNGMIQSRSASETTFKQNYSWGVVVDDVPEGVGMKLVRIILY
tara:strand:- start:12040 stop:12618 length:579 start_codon:yes stop_codon:yes gene_type:complete